VLLLLRQCCLRRRRHILQLKGTLLAPVPQHTAGQWGTYHNDQVKT
jgi:hypothetical protein